ncbi:MAG: cyclic-di-AMP receptor [Armatimonadota bacterium]
MKLVIAVLHGNDQRQTQDNLLEHGIQFTVVASTGGFLREGKVTLLIGIDADMVEQVIEVIRSSCHTREQVVNVMIPIVEPVGLDIPNSVRVVVGGAILFVLEVARFEKM